MEIGVTGSVHYTNGAKIKQVLYKIRESFGTDGVNILSRGKLDGAEPLIKKIALEFGFNYVEYTDVNTSSNLYSVTGPAIKYNLQYSNNIDCDKRYANEVDYLIIFGTFNRVEDKWLNNIYNMYMKRNKNCKIF